MATPTSSIARSIIATSAASDQKGDREKPRRNDDAGSEALYVLAARCLWGAGFHVSFDAVLARRSRGVLCLRAQCRQGRDRSHSQADGARQTRARAIAALSL